MYENKEILKAFLNAYWLRPETAMWRTLDVISMEGFEFVSPSLDLGCGDGTFSFLRGGGRFDDEFDVFTVTQLDSYFDNIDIYDYCSDDQVRIKKESDYKIDVALDHKDSLLKKAKKLKLYNSFIVADANQKLPFHDNTFCSIFSNIIYWLMDPEAVFNEIYRILKPGGRCCVMLPGMQFINNSFYYKYCLQNHDENMEFLERIDRGRVKDNFKTVRTLEEWKKSIVGAGLKIDGIIPHLSSLVISIWDIGLRPIFPVLKKMADSIPKESKLDLKREWVDTFEHFILPIVDNDVSCKQNFEYCFYCFVLSK